MRSHPTIAAVHAATPVRPVHVEQPISFEIKAEESVPVVAPPTAGVRVRGPGLESMMDDAPAEEPTSFEVKAEAPAVDATIEAPPVEAKVEAPAVEPKVEAPAPVEVKAEAPVHEAPAAVVAQVAAESELDIEACPLVLEPVRPVGLIHLLNRRQTVDPGAVEHQVAEAREHVDIRVLLLISRQQVRRELIGSHAGEPVAVLVSA